MFVQFCCSSFSFVFLLIPPPRRSTLFPYTTLFRSSRFEGFGLAALEAMLAGRVLLVSERAGIARQDRKSTRLNSSHSSISYAVFCLKKKTTVASQPAE